MGLATVWKTPQGVSVIITQVFMPGSYDNFSYFVDCAPEETLVVDPFDGNALAERARKDGKKIVGIINTHEHWDHIKGNDALCGDDVAVWAHANLSSKAPNNFRPLVDGETVSLLEPYSLEIIVAPGHTMAHIMLLIKKEDHPYALISGDTLFNAGVGNCHNGGDPTALYETIEKKVIPLADHVILYPGHDYLQKNLQFTLSVDANNEHAHKMLSTVDFSTHQHTTTIGVERKINLFLQLEKLNELGADPRERFLNLRKMRDSF